MTVLFCSASLRQPQKFSEEFQGVLPLCAVALLMLPQTQHVSENQILTSSFIFHPQRQPFQVKHLMRGTVEI